MNIMVFYSCTCQNNRTKDWACKSCSPEPAPLPDTCTRAADQQLPGRDV